MHTHTAPASRWRWLRAYYFEPCKDDLILDGLWPAATRACTMAYFQRDWMGGPNILLGLQTDAADRDRDVQEVAEAVRAYLAHTPSRTEIADAEITRRMDSLRVQEHRLDTPLLAPQPNNSVRIETSEPFSPFLVDDGLKQAVRDFLSHSSGMAVQCLASIRAGHQRRDEICMRLMIALAWLADPEAMRSHLSFSSHVQAFLRVQDRDGQLARQFGARYESRLGDQVRQLVTEVTASLRDNRPLPPPMNEFVALLRTTLRDIYEGLRSGRYRPVPAATLVGNPDRGVVNYSRLIELLDADPAFRTWQITISLLYQVLNQLGMKATERFLACFLLSRAAEDLFGHQATAIRQAMDATGDHRDMLSFFTSLETDQRHASIG